MERDCNSLERVKERERKRERATGPQGTDRKLCSNPGYCGNHYPVTFQIERERKKKQEMKRGRVKQGQDRFKNLKHSEREILLDFK